MGNHILQTQKKRLRLATKFIMSGKHSLGVCRRADIDGGIQIKKLKKGAFTFMEHLPASLTCQPICLPISCPQVYRKLQGDNLPFHPESQHLHTRKRWPTSDPWKAEGPSPEFLRLSSPTPRGKANREDFPHLNLRPEKRATLPASRKRDKRRAHCPGRPRGIGAMRGTRRARYSG